MLRASQSHFGLGVLHINQYIIYIYTGTASDIQMLASIAPWVLIHA